MAYLYPELICKGIRMAYKNTTNKIVKHEQNVRTRKSINQNWKNTPRGKENTDKQTKFQSDCYNWDINLSLVSLEVISKWEVLLDSQFPSSERKCSGFL